MRYGWATPSKIEGVSLSVVSDQTIIKYRDIGTVTNQYGPSNS